MRAPPAGGSGPARCTGGGRRPPIAGAPMKEQTQRRDATAQPSRFRIAQLEERIAPAITTVQVNGGGNTPNGNANGVRKSRSTRPASPSLGRTPDRWHGGRRPPRARARGCGEAEQGGRAERHTLGRPARSSRGQRQQDVDAGAGSARRNGARPGGGTHRGPAGGNQGQVPGAAAMRRRGRASSSSGSPWTCARRRTWPRAGGAAGRERPARQRRRPGRGVRPARSRPTSTT
jgi:hypothetical protein